MAAMSYPVAASATQRPATASRWEPFKALLEAQYLPLLLLALPQSFNVFKWLHTDKTWAGLFFAIVGGLAFEASYVGAIAWADRQAKGKWFWLTALMALGFSVAVAIRVHWPTEAAWSILHAGFPAVAFAYTMIMHNAAPAIDVAELQSAIAQQQQDITTITKRLATAEANEQAAIASLSTVGKDRDDAIAAARKLKQQNEALAQRPAVTDSDIVNALASGDWKLATIAQRLATAGMGSGEIAQRLGTSRQAVDNWLKKGGE